MGALEPVNPILALLDYLEGYRRSWRCWATGGPAAVDDISISRVVEGAVLWANAPMDYQTLLQSSDLKLVGPVWRWECILLSRAADEVPLGDGKFRRLCAEARRAAPHDVEIAADTATQLTDQLAEMDVADAATCGCVCTALEVARRRGEGIDPARFRAYIQSASSVGVALGSLHGRWWIIGDRDRAHGRLLGIRGEVFGVALSTTAVAAMGYWWPQVLLRGIPFGVMLSGIQAQRVGGMRRYLRLLRRDTRCAFGAIPEFARYLAQACRARRTPTAVVLSPDAAASGALYALFGHLAAYAQQADLAQGGMLLGDTYPDLLPMLTGHASSPRWSSTYRVQMADGSRVRLVHMVLPTDGMPDALCHRVLQHADQVWLVLPREMPPEHTRLFAHEVAAGLGDAAQSMLLVREGACEIEIPAGLAIRHWNVDLAGLRDGYLNGAIPPEQAAAVVRWLADSGNTAPAPSHTTAHPAPTQAADSQARRENQRQLG